MTPRLVPIVVLLAVVAAACGDSDADGAAGSSSTVTTSASPSTEASSPATGEAAGPTCHEGSSEATFDDQQGVYATYLTGIDPSAPSLSFDVIQWLVGQDAVDAWQARYPDDPEGPPNDYLIENESPAIRTAPVADDVMVRLVRMAEDEDADVDPGTFDELPAYLAGQPHEPGSLSYNPYWLTFEAGTIVGICEQFIP